MYWSVSSISTLNWELFRNDAKRYASEGLSQGGGRRFESGRSYQEIQDRLPEAIFFIRGSLFRRSVEHPCWVASLGGSTIGDASAPSWLPVGADRGRPVATTWEM